MNFASEIWNKPAAAAAAAADVVTKSLRLDSTSNSRLTWTPSSASSSTRQKCVISFWIKKTILGVSNKWDYVFTAGGTPWFGIAFGATSSGGAKQYLSCGTLPGSDYMPSTYAEYRDPAAWSHYTIALDTTQSTAADRIKVWKDGVALTWGYHTNLFPAVDSNLQIGDAVVHSIGFRATDGGSKTMSGYVADFYLLEHTTLPSGYTNWYDVFAEEDSTTGQWKPKATSGLTFGTNGFHLPFTDSTASTTFIDSSSNASTITANGDVVNSQTQKKVGDSSIYFDGTTDSLSLPSASVQLGAGAFTIEFWKYQVGTGVYQTIYDHGYVDADGIIIQTTLSDTITVYFAYVHVVTEATAPTLNTWQFYQLVRDSSGDVTLYRDGTSVGTGTNSTSLVSSDNVCFGDSINHSASYAFNGYLDEIRVSSTARAASSGPTTAFVSDADTELLIHSNYAGGIGGDTSGNGNNFTATNLAASDVMEDTPTDNYCTMNPLDTHSSNVLSEGNLNFGSSGTAGHYPTFSTMGMRSGKWYWEASRTGGSSWFMAIMSLAHDSGSLNLDSTVGNSTSSVNKVGYSIAASNGNKSHDYGSEYNLGYGSAIGTGGVLMCAFDADNGKIWWGKDGTWFASGDPANGTNAAFTGIDTDTDWGVCIHCYSGHLPWINFGADPTFGGNVSTPDTSEFKHTPPTGFLALSTGSLPTPAIAKPSEHFMPVIYTGASPSDKTVTGVGFQADLTWIKSRNQTYNHALYDSVRGATKELYSNTTAVEVTDTNGLKSWNSDGFVVGSDGEVGDLTGTRIAWSWKKSATAGFNIVTWTGNDDGMGASPVPQAITHGLNPLTPEMIIAKNRVANSTTTGDWAVWHTDLTSGKYLTLNSSAAETSWTYALFSSIGATTASVSNDTITSSIYLNYADDTGGYGDDDTYVGYFFASVEGYSKVGSYTGNASADGTFVYCGFRPAFIMVKRITTTGENWGILDAKRDTYNPTDEMLSADSSGSISETTLHNIDFCSNGFKIRNSHGTWNSPSGDVFIFYAVAESPFKYASAR